MVARRTRDCYWIESANDSANRERGLGFSPVEKALAAVFEIDITALESKGLSLMVKHEYKTLNISVKRGFMSGITKTPLPNLEEILNAEGAHGWRLAQILTPDVLSSAGKATETWVALLERPIVES